MGSGPAVADARRSWQVHLAPAYSRPVHDERPRPLQLDLPRLVAALQALDCVEYAWLFGSRATGKARADSDVDLAIGLTDGAALEPLSPTHERILRALDAIVPNERMDLVALTHATPTALRHQVFKHGKLLFAKTQDRLVPLRVATAREWGDGQARREEYWKTIQKHIERRAWPTPQ